MSATGQRVHDVILRGGRTLRLRPPSEARRGRCAAVPDGALADEHAAAIPWHPPRRRCDGRELPRPGLDERGRAPGHRRGRGRGRPGDRVGELFPTARPAPGGGLVRRGRRPPGRRDRNTAARADRRRGRQGGDRALRRRGAAREPADAAGLRRLGLRGQTAPTTASEIRVEFPIRFDERYREAVDCPRSYRCRAVAVGLSSSRTSVAVVGASAREGSIGGAVFRNILEAGYTGSVFPVNRSGEPVAGHPARASVAELPVPIDLAVIAVPSGAVQGAVAEALAAGAKAVVRDLGRIRRNRPDRSEAPRPSCLPSSARTARAWSARTASASSPPGT